jgi:REP element-mobilizing transposase RayT
MRKKRRFVLGEPDGRCRYVHVVTRTAGQQLLFGDLEREVFRKILFKQLKFSGLRALAWCFMGNHLHLLLEVPDKGKALEGWAEEDFIARLAVFGDEMSTRLTLGDVEMFRRNGHAAGVAEVAARVRARLFDLSVFMKELKQRMTLAYNFAHGRGGTLWEGRFKCVRVEGGDALRAVAAYIDLNPVRAGLAQRPEDYRWCSYAAAVAGVRLARAGLAAAVSIDKKLSWTKAAERYREYLFGVGAEVEGGQTPDGHVAPRGGFTRREIEAVLAAGGRLTLAQALRCRVRYFTDGAVLGSQAFVDEFFEAQRGALGMKRTSGGRRMKGAEWGGLRVLRALKDDVVVLPNSG